MDVSLFFVVLIWCINNCWGSLGTLGLASTVPSCLLVTFAVGSWVAFVFCYWGQSRFVHFLLLLI